MMQVSLGSLTFIPESPMPVFMAATGTGEGGQFPGGHARLRVLVVDDESTITETLVEILRAEGFEAAGASTGYSAIELARTFEPDVVISDVVIPGMNGIEAGIRIRDIRPDCKIILFSGQAATVDLLKKARENGYDFEILAKPIKPEVLISTIRRCGPGSSGDDSL